MFNQDFYPTPDHLISRMLESVDLDIVSAALDPSAGKGNILDFLSNEEKMREIKLAKKIAELNKAGDHRKAALFKDRHSNWSTYAFKPKNLHAIEINPDLQATLRGKDYPVIDTDYLSNSGSEHFDLIIANYPFSNGHLHLLKSIDTMFRGQIVCLLNAETIRNPYCNDRKRLVSLLEKLNADIEYIQDAFTQAERKTNVEIALIYIHIKRQVEHDLFDQLSTEGETTFEPLKENTDIVNEDKVSALVDHYATTKTSTEKQVVSFYQNYHYGSKYLNISIKETPGKSKNTEDLTNQMRCILNSFYKRLKRDHWEETLKLDNVAKYVCKPVRDEILSDKNRYTIMEFTHSNIRQFILNLSQNFPNMIQKSIEHVFDKMTEHAIRAKDSYWSKGEYEKSIHYYNAWKTNSGYKINKKVIQPFYNNDYDGNLRTIWDSCKSDFLNDLELICDYFTSETPKENNIIQIINQSIERGITRNIITRHFKISLFKKGTIHLTFLNENTLRQLNISAAKYRGWLPYEYAHKSYQDLNDTEQQTVNQFEGKSHYQKLPEDNLYYLSLNNQLTNNISRLLIGSDIDQCA